MRPTIQVAVSLLSKPYQFDALVLPIRHVSLLVRVRLQVRCTLTVMNG